MINVVLVDDHHLVREGVKTLIQRDAGLELLAEAEHSSRIFSVLKAHGAKAQVLILDIHMASPPRFYPEIEVPGLLKHYPDLKIIVLSGDDRVPVIQKMIALGASGYVLKDTHESLEELSGGIRTVCRGGKFYSRRVLHLLLNAEPVFAFSPRERDVARLLVKGIANKGIANQLFLSEKYVEKLVSTLRCKLAVPESDPDGFPLNSRVFMAAALREMGY